MSSSSTAAALDPRLLEILVCPADHGALTPVADTLVCTTCARAFPVRDGVPVMLLDEAIAPPAHPAP